MNSRSAHRLDALLVMLAITSSLALAIITVTSESFWIDEYASYVLAHQPNFMAWLQNFLSNKTSDIQKPLYHLYAFGWTHLFGLTEHQIRAANAPWLMASFVVAVWSLRRTPLLAACIGLALALHPMLWFYMNDAQPYVMFYSNTVLCFAGLYGIHIWNEGQCTKAEARGSLVLLCAGTFLLSSTMLLGVSWAIGFLCVGFWLWGSGSSRYHVTAIDVAIFAAYAVMMAALGLFYVHTLLKGSSATPLHESSVLTLAFSAYEILGLGGVGPGRNDLRDHGIQMVFEYLPYILVGVLVIGGFLSWSASQFVRAFGVRRSVPLLTTILVPIVFTSAVGFSMNWRVLGRHFMPAAVVVSLLAGFGVWYALKKGGLLVRAIALVFSIFLVVSAASYKAPRHAKEDFRLAAALASDYATKGSVVWWTAYGNLAEHYGLRLTELRKTKEDCNISRQRGSALLVSVFVLEHCLGIRETPEYIFLSRPDAYDPEGHARSYAQTMSFEEVDAPVGFRIWRRTRSP